MSEPTKPPTKAQIRKACEAIRANWRERDWRRQTGYASRVGVRIVRLDNDLYDTVLRWSQEYP